MRLPNEKLLTRALIEPWNWKAGISSVKKKPMDCSRHPFWTTWEKGRGCWELFNPDYLCSDSNTDRPWAEECPIASIGFLSKSYFYVPLLCISLIAKSLSFSSAWPLNTNHLNFQCCHKTLWGFPVDAPGSPALRVPVSTYWKPTTRILVTNSFHRVWFFLVMTDPGESAWEVVFFFLREGKSNEPLYYWEHKAAAYQNLAKTIHEYKKNCMEQIKPDLYTACCAQPNAYDGKRRGRSIRYGFSIRNRLEGGVLKIWWKEAHMDVCVCTHVLGPYLLDDYGLNNGKIYTVRHRFSIDMQAFICFLPWKA